MRLGNTHPDFFTTNSDKLLEMVKALVTQRLNLYMSLMWAWPLRHIHQRPTHQENSKWRTPSQSKSLEQNVCHAEAFESTLWDQNSMASTLDITIAWMSTYHRQKNNTPTSQYKECLCQHLPRLQQWWCQT